MKTILTTLSEEESISILNRRLDIIADLFREAYNELNNPAKSLKVCKEAMQLYFETESLLEKLAEGDKNETD